MNGNASPIVQPRAQTPAQSAQRAGLRDLVLHSTGELNEFGEQPYRFSDSTHPPQSASIEWPLHHQSHHLAHHTSTITGNNTSHRWGGLQAEAMANQSWLQHQAERAVDTTNYRGNSQSAKEGTEEMNRERSLGSEADSSHQHRQNLPQHNTAASGIPLASLPHHTPQIYPHSHAATAAEIALGIAPPFHSREENRIQHQAMALHRTRPPVPETNNKPADISSVIESLSEVKDRDEEDTSRTSETGLVTSPGRMTPLNDSSEHGASDNPRLGSMGIGTPSTVSTAPSTDDASLGADYRLDDSHLPNLLHGLPGHTRTNSWGEEGLLPGVSGGHFMPQLHDSPWMQGPPSSSFAARNQWGPSELPGQQQHRIASFRQTEQNPDGRAGGHNPVWPLQQAPHYAQHQQQAGHYAPEQSIQQFGSHAGQQGHPEMRQRSPHQVQQYDGYHQGARKGGPTQGAVPLVGTPPRPTGSRNPRQPVQPAQPSQRQHPQGVHGGSPHQPGSSTQRSSSEILKTLLRKKACLYEPDTSRSVALVTWLVGRELALEFGFFSRQQLQSGVHACVSDKIDSGIITRTKVNRCMQIILNSCFHYIIPRSDGSEEKGDVFRGSFLRTVQDDSLLLQYLPAPWNNLEVDRESILLASMAEEEERLHHPHKTDSSPKSSPRMTSVEAPSSPGKDSKGFDDGDSKRAVLLCFNENVRSAEDVFRCHNEFIRDTANAAHLQLTAQEWRSFFGREAARAPYLWGNIGIPIPSSEAKTGASRHNDPLGQMSEDEASKFRTTWCAKRYDHDHDLCGFAHVEISGGWLRRNPAVHQYQDQMCEHVSSVIDKRVSPSHFFVNQCPEGVDCDKAHSMEEIIYHPRRYKTKNCTAALSRSGWCQLGDVCPNIHPAEASKPSKRHGDGRSHGPRQSKKNEQSSGAGAKPGYVALPGSPMIYASPAPVSSFERHLGMPGLQNLFRRHCSVVRAHAQKPEECTCVYNCFGDDSGINDTPSLAPKARSGLPTPERT